MELKLELKPIGFVKSPYHSEAPRQGRFSDEVCELIIYPEFADGLKGIEDCRHIIVLYWMDKADRKKLRVTPPEEVDEKGVFATRSPSRPNPIGFCVAEIIEVKDNSIKVRWMDALNGSPIIDIKKYSSEIDCV